MARKDPGRVEGTARTNARLVCIWQRSGARSAAAQSEADLDGSDDTVRDVPYRWISKLEQDLASPTLIEVRGCVLLARKYDTENFDLWWIELGGDVPRIESVINHIHLWDEFPDQDDDQALSDLLRVIERGWREVLAKTFPERTFDVVIGDDPEDYGPTVTFSSTAQLQPSM